MGVGLGLRGLRIEWWLVCSANIVWFSAESTCLLQAWQEIPIPPDEIKAAATCYHSAVP